MGLADRCTLFSSIPVETKGWGGRVNESLETLLSLVSWYGRVEQLCTVPEPSSGSTSPTSLTVNVLFVAATVPNQGINVLNRDRSTTFPNYHQFVFLCLLPLNLVDGEKSLRPSCSMGSSASTGLGTNASLVTISYDNRR